MVTARAKYVIRQLKRKYGIVGVVASRYIEAGYSVELFHKTRLGNIDILVRGRGEVYAIEILHRGTYTVDHVKLLQEKAKLVRARPVLVLYGRQPRLTAEASSYCSSNNIKVKRILPQK